MNNSRPYRNRCDQVLDHLYEYLNRKDLTAEDVQEIRRHLGDCPPCGGRYAFEEHLVERLRTADPCECPDTLRRRVRALLDR
jgi:anti-sigma factor (TIGR02949 family)